MFSQTGIIIIPNVLDEILVVTWNITENCHRLFAVLQLNSGRNTGKSCSFPLGFSPLTGGHTMKTTAPSLSHTQLEKGTWIQ